MPVEDLFMYVDLVRSGYVWIQFKKLTRTVYYNLSDFLVASCYLRIIVFKRILVMLYAGLYAEQIIL